MRQKVEDLWRLCFNDSEEFTRFYFEHKYNPENTLVEQDGNGNVIAALQMLPYSMKFGNKIFPVSYISGACTHPEYRKKGLMKKLLFKAFVTMNSRNIPLSILIPQEEWLFEYYEKVNYSTIFTKHFTEPVQLLEIKNRHLAVTQFDRIDTDFDRLYEFYNNKQREKDCTILHDKEDFQIILEDLFLCEGSLFVCYESNHIVGLAFVYPEEGNIVVKEIIDNYETVRQILINNIFHFCSGKKILIREEYNVENLAENYGMARVVNVEMLLGYYAAQNTKIDTIIRVIDEILPYNTAFYRLTKGNCFKQSSIGDENFYELSIGEIAKAIFTNESIFNNNPDPYMSLMLD